MEIKGSTLFLTSVLNKFKILNMMSYERKNETTSGENKMRNTFTIAATKNGFAVLFSGPTTRWALGTSFGISKYEFSSREEAEKFGQKIINKSSK